MQQKRWKLSFRQAFGVRSTQKLVKIYNKLAQIRKRSHNSWNSRRQFWKEMTQNIFWINSRGVTRRFREKIASFWWKIVKFVATVIISFFKCQNIYIRAFIIIFFLAILGKKLSPKTYKNRQNGDKSPHLVTLDKFDESLQFSRFHKDINFFVFFYLHHSCWRSIVIQPNWPLLKSLLPTATWLLIFNWLNEFILLVSHFTVLY